MEHGVQREQDRVLLVDDDPMVRILVRKALTRHGFDVADAGGGERGLVVFREWRPAIVLLDARMEGMDGFDTCRALRAAPGGLHVPVVMLTGLDDDASIAQAYDAGATDFYVKSPQLTLLVQRVRYLLRTSRMRDELARSRTRLARAQRIARLGSWEWDLKARTVTATTECLALLGLLGGEQAMSEAGFISVLRPDGPDAFRFEALARLKAGRPYRFECSVQVRDGTRQLAVEVDGERDETGTIARTTGVVQDVTERRETEERAQRLASFDGLTGLANRSRFRARLAEALAASSEAAVMVIGLDRFKLVNQSIGHDAGDAVLVEAAARIESCARRSAEGVSLARLGGDEFAVLLHGAGDMAAAGAVADRVRSELRRPFLVDGAEIWIAASVGAAAAPGDADTADTLLQRADAAMRSAKASGGDCFRAYEAASAARDVARLRIEPALRKALERGELRLHWQPIVHGATGRVRAAEVLMRWEREDGLVSPAEFIPLAEETGLIVPMGEWALETACRQLADWWSGGLEGLQVAINLSGAHLQRPDVRRVVHQALARSGLPTQALTLEITETVLMDFLEPTLRTLQELRESGVRIAIDDFGTGYSSLSYLRRLPVSAVKIDRSFVMDVATDPHSAAIVTAIAGLASTLSLGTVVEGVETDPQRLALLACGADAMQGYLFSRPLAPEAFEAFARASIASGPRYAPRSPESTSPRLIA